MVDKQVDILIIGGGIIGATLLIALQDLGLETLLIESTPFSDKTNPDFDARSIALSRASVRLFQALGLWTTIQATASPVEKIHVTEAGRFGAARLESQSSYPLGYTVEIQYIHQALAAVLPKNNMLVGARVVNLENNKALIQTKTKTLRVQAKLIVAADGADSAMRTFCSLACKTKMYNQQAIVANIGLEKPHQQKALERFTSQGPLALLPLLHNRLALIWTLKTDEAQKHMQMSDADFLKALQALVGYRYGRLQQVGKRTSWPVREVLMPIQTAWPVVFLGNAAHTLHPVAAQGLNLGLRDVAVLVECIREKGLNPVMLEEYKKLRQHDQWVITCGTDLLAECFTSQIPGLGFLRSAGLVLFDNMPFLKGLLARYALGFGGYNPELICESSTRKGL